jgi:hypothetical protein
MESASAASDRLNDKSSGKENTRKPIIDFLKAWAETSTFHALPNISRSEKVLLKLIWIAFFVIAFAYFSYGAVKIFIDYFSYNVNTEINVYRETKMEFPTISFCNRNMFKINQHNFPLSKYLRNAYQQALLTNDGLFGTLTTETLTSYSNMYVPYGFNFTDEEKFNLSYTIDDMLLNCRFNLMPCDKSQFEYFHTSSNGNCYKFNSGVGLNGSQLDSLYSSNPGRRYGLTLELFTGYMSSLDLIKTSGIQMFVHNSSSQPIIDAQGIGLSVGYHTDIVLTKTVYNKQPAPYSDCLDTQDTFDSDLFRSTVSITGTYEQKFCLQLCFQRYLINSCGCYDVTSISFNNNNSSACNITQILECGHLAFVNFYKSPMAVSCFQECPQECTLVEYNLALSQSDFPTPFYADLLMQYDRLYNNDKKNFTSYQQVKQSVISVDIFFSELAYTSIDEVPAKTFEQFFGDIGGLMGLCIGTSLLSFIEFIELLITLAQILVSSRGKTSPVNLN